MVYDVPSTAILETPPMGRVVVAAKIENLDDLYKAKNGLIPSEQVRQVEVMDALVDTGSAGLLLPKRVIAQLGLKPFLVRQARTVGGMVPLTIYRAVRLSVQGRDCLCDAGEVSDELPVVIGQIPLEMLDWVVDTKNQRLINNPDSGGILLVGV